MSTLAAILRDEPPVIDAPGDLSRVVMRCLRKNPAERWPAARELKSALGGVSFSSGSPPSIAVLPFADMSPARDQEYFSDGLAEEIINALTRIPNLKVIARTSAFAFKGKNEDIRRIAESLGVANILEGSVRSAGSRVRVTAQLINATDGSHLWSQRYDRDLADIFAVQDEIAQGIAAALKVTLVTDAVLPPRPPTLNQAAYEALLKSDYHFRRATPEGSLRCKAYLEEAIALDPGFALAHSRLGRYFLSAYTTQRMPAHDAAPLARRHALRALELDPSLSEAHSVMGCLAAMYDYDWIEADRRFRLACVRDPVSLMVRVERANFFLAHAGRAREAVEELERALREDPLNPHTLWTLAVSLRAAGRDTDADVRYREVVDMDIGSLSAIAGIVLSGNHGARGAIQESLAFAETAVARAPWIPAGVGQLAGVLALTGNHERAEALVRQLLPGTAFGAPFGLALRHLAVGDLDQAADWLEQAIAQRDLWVSFLLRVGNIGGRVMWSSPRWSRLARLLNVPETS